MLGMGLRLADVARVLGVSVPTLRKNFAEEIRTAALQANAAVRLSLYQQATGTGGKKPNVLAAMFWLKVRDGWVETEKLLRSLAAGGKKEAQAEAAAKAASSGKFKPAAPPRLATVNGEPVKPEVPK